MAEVAISKAELNEILDVLMERIKPDTESMTNTRELVTRKLLSLIIKGDGVCVDPYKKIAIGSGVSSKTARRTVTMLADAGFVLIKRATEEDEYRTGATCVIATDKLRVQE